MTSQVGAVLQAVAKAEQCRPARYPALVSSISITNGRISCLTPSGAKIAFDAPCRDEDVMVAFNKLYPGLELVELREPATWPAPPWPPDQGWGNYLYDLGCYEHLLDDFSPRLTIRHLALTPEGIVVEVGDLRSTIVKRLPLDGTGFTGALTVELAADFMAAIH